MSKKNPKTADFHIRMTPEERANIDETAEKCGLTRSDLIRLLAQLYCARHFCKNSVTACS